MTLKDFMEENYPSCIKADIIGGVVGCPETHSFLKGHYDEDFTYECCTERFRGNCEKCWNQPYIETTDTTEPPEETDNVNHPKHYTGDVECIDVLIQTQGVEAVKGFCICNAFKYLWRRNAKNGDEDIKKAIWYLNKYVELVRGENEK